MVTLEIILNICLLKYLVKKPFNINGSDNNNELPLSFIILESWLDKKLYKEMVLYTYILYVYIYISLN